MALCAAAPSQRIFIASDSEDRTYSATVAADGTLRDLVPFAERGGESVAEDSAGNVFIANGQVFIYDKTGKPIGEIDVPERAHPASVRRRGSPYFVHPEPSQRFMRSGCASRARA